MGRRVVVTGGGGGIGRAIVERFRTLGADVVAVGRGGSDVDEICDMTDEQAVASLFARVGDVDVLVNSAGIGESETLERTSLELWHRHLEANATAPFLCIRQVLPGMLARDRGRLVTVASTAGLAGARYAAAYAASKHAAVGLMRSVAAEVAGTGVTANAVCPAYVRTEMTERTVARIVERTARTADETAAALGALSPLGRLLEPAEVAGAVVYLASDEAAALNGQALVLDGGGIQR